MRINQYQSFALELDIIRIKKFIKKSKVKRKLKSILIQF